jgi:hypothetical protein
MFDDCFGDDSSTCQKLDHDAEVLQEILRRILWHHMPKPAQLDSYSASNYLYFDASYVAHSQFSTLFVILVNSLGVVT